LHWQPQTQPQTYSSNWLLGDARPGFDRQAGVFFFPYFPIFFRVAGSATPRPLFPGTCEPLFPGLVFEHSPRDSMMILEFPVARHPLII
jgi:hypothetical protein